ncbi:hypothetical protein BRADI_5g18546v3 [Brachypodium distachyon]|nr:hypothetical protein BRADI_5g18546v3 [Brachypodium distachyon]PNT61675.1 hypothetical protein BRADI_5g18546v3 [Brachypodium distachyon]
MATEHVHRQSTAAAAQPIHRRPNRVHRPALCRSSTSRRHPPIRCPSAPTRFLITAARGLAASLLPHAQGTIPHPHRGSRGYRGASGFEPAALPFPPPPTPMLRFASLPTWIVKCFCTYGGSEGRIPQHR